MDIDDVEILVHISAPSTRKNDDTYRAEAVAYASFSGVRIEGSTPENRAFSQSQKDRESGISFEQSQDDGGAVDSHRLAHPLEHLEILQDQWRSTAHRTRASWN